MMREMQAAGNEIASHTLTHADLPTLGARALRRQIVGAQDLLERHLGERPITFCYPFGHHDRTVRQALRRAGIQLAFTTDWGAVHDARSPLRSPRIRVSGWDSPSAVLARIAPFSRVAPASSVPWARPPSVGTIHAA
jgi:peptidoglycan/xylan/chitin deacetylase (PgdA/CDA1 family)